MDVIDERGMMRAHRMGVHLTGGGRHVIAAVTGRGDPNDPRPQPRVMRNRRSVKGGREAVDIAARGRHQVTTAGRRGDCRHP